MSNIDLCTAMGLYDTELKMPDYRIHDNKKSKKKKSSGGAHGIQCSSSSGNTSPESTSLYQKRRMKSKSSRQRAPNLQLNNGHARSVSDGLAEKKPSKPQTPKPKYSSVSSLKDLQLYFSMQNLAPKVADDNGKFKNHRNQKYKIKLCKESKFNYTIY